MIEDRSGKRGTALPDWKVANDYAILMAADRSAFAWEWLRRSPAYRATWARRCSSEGAARQFGLERMEDPSLAVPLARPVWSRTLDPSVVVAAVDDPEAGQDDRINLWRLSGLASIAIDSDETEHILLSEGTRFLRIDIVEGTLIGCPASLRYFLSGIGELEKRMATLGRLIRLIRLMRDERINHIRAEPSGRRARWILELRIADALATGATHQEIARVLFGPMIPDQRWRQESRGYRLRVQRLARNARLRLASPLDQRWFATTTHP